MLTTAMRFRHLGVRNFIAAPHPGFAGPGHTQADVITPSDFAMTDPFVLLADDRIDFEPGRQIGGAHPHAGLETVTFVLEGAVHDRDEGLLEAGDVAWMTAGRGVIHNENVRAMGPARVLQLWVTLPERERDAAPRLDVIRGRSTPVFVEPGVEARLYSGATQQLRSTTRNYVPVTLVDIRLEPGARFDQELPATYNGFILPIEGEVVIEGTNGPLCVNEIGWIDRDGGAGQTRLRITAGARGARALVYAGESQYEPTVTHGPFVAGSMDSIKRMYRDYREGKFMPISLIRAVEPVEKPSEKVAP